MKKKPYKTPKGASFRTYFHGNRFTNNCSFRRVPQKKPGEGRKNGTAEVTG